MTVSAILQQLLSDRGLDLNPPHPDTISWSDLGISDKDIKKALKIIKKHTQLNNKIALYGDYDVDGISSVAILWQTLYPHYPSVFPHIPDRRLEGYGLSRQGIDRCLAQGAQLIITADSGIVAFEAIDYAKSQGMDVIIIDHHSVTDHLPKADAIVHSTATCAAGLSYFFARELLNIEHWTLNTNLLDLACLAVICDLVPLTGINRSIAKYGLEALSRTTRPGLLALYDIAGINQPPMITAYHVGFIIGPRLNATGRLTHALDSLRLLCTNNIEKASEYAKTLNETNLKRQQLTESLTNHAIQNLPSPQLNRGLPAGKAGAGGEVVGSDAIALGAEAEVMKEGKIIVVADPAYDEGVIGLIAAKLVEKYYRPAIAISVGPDISKASARSIPGFHITDCLQQFSSSFHGVGGHSMAAGFSFSTAKLTKVLDLLNSVKLPLKLLVKPKKFDLLLQLSDCTLDLWQGISQLQPFGIGNPTPVFLAQNLIVSQVQPFGRTLSHLKFTVTQDKTSASCVWFSPPPDLSFQTGDTLDSLYFQLDADTFRGQTNLRLLVKSI